MYMLTLLFLQLSSISTKKHAVKLRYSAKMLSEMRWVNKSKVEWRQRKYCKSFNGSCSGKPCSRCSIKCQTSSKTYYRTINAGLVKWTYHFCSLCNIVLYPVVIIFSFTSQNNPWNIFFFPLHALYNRNSGCLWQLYLHQNKVQKKEKKKTSQFLKPAFAKCVFHTGNSNIV